MKKKLTITFILCICLLAVISPVLGGTVPLDIKDELSVTDSAGTQVTLTAPAERIVSLAPAVTEILFTLGLGEKVVGVTEYCTYPPEAKNKPKIGSFSAVSPEKVINSKPDLVIGSKKTGDKVVTRLREMQIPVYVTDPGTVDELCSTIISIATLCGVTEKGEKESARIKDSFSRMKSATESLNHPRTAQVIWNDPLYVAGGGTFQDDMITSAGGENIFARKEGYPTISLEEFVKADPEVILANSGSGMTGNETSIVDTFKNDPRYSLISAVKNDRVIMVQSDLSDRAGPRITDGLSLFAKAIHPEISKE